MPTSQQLKAGLDHTSKTALTQFNKTSDRLEKIEKAQAEPSARLAKLSEAVEKLRAAPAPAPVVAAAAPAAVAPAAPKEVTGSVTPSAVARCAGCQPRLRPQRRRSPKSAACRRSKAGRSPMSAMAAR